MRTIAVRRADGATRAATAPTRTAVTAGAQPIRTARLVLVPCDGALLGAVMRDEPLPGLERHPEWPGDELRGAIPFMLAGLIEHPERVGWGPWLIVQDSMVVGDIGGHGPPAADGGVEIGFSVVPSMRSRGIAGEALASLLAWMRRDSGFRCAFARTHAGNVAARAVLSRCGFRQDAREGDLVVFTSE